MSTHPNERRDATGARPDHGPVVRTLPFFPLFFPVKTERCEEIVGRGKREDESMRMGRNNGLWEESFFCEAPIPFPP